MVSVLETVFDALSAEGWNVTYARPADLRSLPLVLLRESINRTAAMAGGAPYLTELEYTVEAYHGLLGGAETLGAEIDRVMAGLNFRRTAYLLERTEAEQGHIRARYTGYADAEGNIYTHI